MAFVSRETIEQHDLSNARPGKLAELQQALAQHNAAREQPAWPSKASIAINIDKDLSQPDATNDEYLYRPNE